MFMKKILVLSSLLLSSVAFSQTFDYNKKWGLGGSGGFNFPIFGNDFNTEADSGETWSLYGRYHLTSADAIEAAFTKHEFQDTTKALNVSDITYVRRFLPMDRFTPIAGIGAGLVDISNYDPGSLKLGLKLRAGMEYAITNSWNLGLNVDYQHVTKMLFDDNLPGHNIHVIAARLGLTWYFGGAAPAIAGAGAAGAAAMASKGPIEKLDVHYTTGDAHINPAYKNDLKELAQFMEEHPSTTVELQGYADSTGTPEINRELSQQRAEEVKDELVMNYDVEARRIETVGYGQEKPLAENSTSDGRTQNRRVIGVIKQ
jgi:outer membrane protein OmpA-like peptidoglycan-associated protein